MESQTVVYPFNRVLSRNMKEHLTSANNTLDKSHRIILMETSHSEKYITHHVTFMLSKQTNCQQQRYQCCLSLAVRRTDCTGAPENVLGVRNIQQLHWHSGHKGCLHSSRHQATHLKWEYSIIHQLYLWVSFQKYLKI